jgi:hypothetical protein
MPLAFVLLNSNDPEHRSRVATALIPAIAPVAVAQRVAIAAVAADQTVSDSERREQRAADETAAETVAAVSLIAERVRKGDDAKLTDGDLDTLPQLKRLIGRSPEIRTQIEGSLDGTVVANGTDAVDQTVAAVGIVQKHKKDGDPPTLTDADLKKLPVLNEVLSASAALKGKIEKVAVNGG